MEEAIKNNNIDSVPQDQPSSQKTVQSPVPTPEIPKKKTVLIVGGVILVLAFLGVIGAFAYQNYQFKKQAFQPQPSTEKTTVNPTPTTEPIADWKVYKNETFDFSLKYPKQIATDNEVCYVEPSYVEEPPFKVRIATIGICKHHYSFGITIFTNPQKLDVFRFWKNYKENDLNGRMNCNSDNSNCTLSYTHESGNFDSHYYVENMTINNEKAIRLTKPPDPKANFYSKATELFINHNNSIYRIQYENNIELDHQILSTFKFLDKSEETESVSCGGWDTSGEVVCKCLGKLTKPSCPSDTLCDGGTYYCEGQCTDCCYKGIAENHPLPKCNR